MMKIMLSVIGWILLFMAILSICIRLFAADEVIASIGGSRNLDYPVSIIAFAIIFIGIGSVIGKLDQLLKREPTLE